MAEPTKICKWARLLLICALSGVIWGCYYYKALKDLKGYEKLYGLVGEVSTLSGKTQNVIVALYSGNNGSKTIIQYAFPMRSGVFSFFVPEGTYRLSAFDDTNSNMKHDVGESGGHFGSPDRILVSSETVDNEMEAIRGLDIAIEPEGFGLDEDMHTVDVSALTRSAVLRVGQRATLESSKFKAAKGVEKAPAAIPCWRDLDPQSNFLEALYREKLPPSVSFHMLFSYRGSCLPYMSNNDGTIELSSLLDFRAQSESERVWGHDEDHDSILTSHAATNQIFAILNAEHEIPAINNTSQPSPVD